MFHNDELTAQIPALKRSIISFGHNDNDADDLTQEVIVRALEKRETFKGKSTLFSFLYRIAYNLHVDYIRRGKYVPKALRNEVLEALSTQDDSGRSDVLLASCSPERLFAKEESEDSPDNRSERLAVALTDLPEDDQIIIRLRYFEKKEYDEIATLEGISPTLARVRLSRAIGRLRTKLFLEAS